MKLKKSAGLRAEMAGLPGSSCTEIWENENDRWTRVLACTDNPLVLENQASGDNY